ncbi:hypothetical protein BVRB_4g096920 [Beta vulgaris subsp. vulgaris]|uniref:Uncharacterized protein n=1 Tax=Beta vulgaris subsp. vulgaris TaxID=3555 RepID=A0A0J8BD26_BETVV|nr:hypothetical protein BVRB_4g096920 [Beta vulgaris subsp. vulgaris]
MINIHYMQYLARLTAEPRRLQRSIPCCFELRCHCLWLSNGRGYLQREKRYI